MMKRDTAALLVCAGSATRMGGIHKILHPLGDTTVLAEVLRRFCCSESTAEIVLICRPADLADFQAAADAAGLSAEITVTVTAGGNTRQQSVRNGFLSMQSDADYVAIHDGARPLVLPEDIERVIADARRTGAASLGVPVKDTVKVVRRGIIADTPDRSLLYLTQTPQVFRRSLYADAMALAAEQGRDYTDDCQLVEALGLQVTMTTGDYSNIKLTTPEDFAIAEALLREQQKEAF